MADRRLSRLMLDSGYAATAGQSFINNVSGGNGGGGTRMTDYVLTDWVSFTDPVGYPTQHQSGETYRFQWDFTQGSRRALIGPALTAIDVSDTSADPAQTEILAYHTAADAGDHNYIDVKLHGKAGASTTYDDIPFRITFPQDANGFNNALTHDFTARIVRRGVAGGGGGTYPPEQTPVSLSIADNGDGSATGTWANTNEDGTTTGIRIEWQSLSGGVWTTFDSHSLGNTVTTHRQTGIANGTVVRFRVIYTNAGGDSSWGYATSGQVTVTGSVSPPSETPSSVTLANAGGGIGRASWSNTNSTDGIEIQFYKDSEPFGSPIQVAANSTTVDKSGYTASTEGTCDVYYFNGGGNGPAGSGGPAFF
jgi:hypothetical protein